METGTQEFRHALLDAGLLVSGGAAGVYHRSFAFECVVRGIETYVSAAGRDADRRQLLFSSLMDQSVLVKSGFVSSFPNLVGVLTSFTRPEAELPELLEQIEADGDWPGLLSPNGLALCGAACQPLYPSLADTEVPLDGLLYEIQATCFRHEPSDDPARMQSFRQHEFVYVGSESGATAHRDLWLQRGAELLETLGLSVERVPANDPFFGRAGKLMGSSQREKAAKFELVAEITSSSPGAISSGNCHGDHFGEAFGISLPGGGTAHTSCIGFGLERITLALLHRHGLDIAVWPSQVRSNLALVSPVS
jgi:seryl-tRNA synthetase